MGTPTPPRDFPDVFQLGDIVSVKRHRHGWTDGCAEGTITDIGPGRCTVRGTLYYTGGSYESNFEIPKPRDLDFIERPTNRQKKRTAKEQKRSRGGTTP